MQVTILGSGDAFCSGGRANSSIRVDAGGACLALEFGASALLSWKRAGYASLDVDGVVISHLHGDHFGGLPFLLLDCQYVALRKKPLRIAGPKGLRARLEMAMEVFFPGSGAIHWSFPWEVVELTPAKSVSVAGFDVSCQEVIHPSGAPALGLRVARGRKLLAFSGDTSWTPNLLKIADKAGLFICECFSGADMIPNHLSWDVILDHLPQLKAKRIVLTHMNDTAFAREAEMQAAGVEVARDGSSYKL